MRIRKCASKLLGSTTAYFPLPPPRLCLSPSWDSQSASTTATAGLLCQLNRSPWDVVPHLQQEEEDAEDDDSCIAANGIKVEEKPKTLIIKSEEIKLEKEWKSNKKKKKKVKRKRKEKEIDSAAKETAETPVLCKKSDGKGWRCKRPAHLPHSLCHYHLAQLRSYTSNSHSKVADVEIGDGDKHRKRKADASGDSTNFYYYYYSGFGPWRGKRRGGNNSSDTNGGGCGGGGGGDVSEEEEEGREISASVDGRTAAVAGDDEEDNEEEEEDDEGKSSSEVDYSDEEIEKRNCRKRGRKPVKARSLKSLL